MYCVIDDMKTNVREAFVIKSDEWDAVSSQYSGYYIVERYETEDEAELEADLYNNYVEEPDVMPPCNKTCSIGGCCMSAKEYAQWNRQCAYCSK